MYNIDKLSSVARKAGNAVMLMDYNGNIEWINQSYTDLYGFTFDSLLEHKGGSIFGKDTPSEVKVAFGKCIINKETTHFETQNTHRNGKKIWVSTTITPVIENNEVIKLIIIDTNIDRHKQLELKLKEQKEAIESQAAEIVTKIEKLNQVNRKLEKKQTEIEKQNEILQIQSEYLTITNNKLNKQKKELQCTFEKLKNTEKQLVEREKLASIGVLTAGIAHEINNPVNYIINGLEALKPLFADFMKLIEMYDNLKPENIKESIKGIDRFKASIDFEELIPSINIMSETIKNGALRITEQIKGMRTFTQSGDKSLKLVDIHTNIDSTLVLLRNLYKNRITIIKNYGNIPEIECFPGKLNQVFMNLLVNAIQSIETKGRITITTATNKTVDPDGILVNIEDTGKGIPKDMANKIFSPFFTTKPHGKGTGLGLSISLDIIKNHNGRIEFNSKVGYGTTFKMYLPIHPNK